MLNLFLTRLCSSFDKFLHSHIFFSYHHRNTRYLNILIATKKKLEKLASKSTRFRQLNWSVCFVYKHFTSLFSFCLETIFRSTLSHGVYLKRDYAYLLFRHVRLFNTNSSSHRKSLSLNNGFHFPSVFTSLLRYLP